MRKFKYSFQIFRLFVYIGLGLSVWWRRKLTYHQARAAEKAWINIFKLWPDEKNG